MCVLLTAWCHNHKWITFCHYVRFHNFFTMLLVVVVVLVVVLVVPSILLRYFNLSNSSTFSPVSIAAPLLTVCSEHFCQLMCVFSIVVVDYETHNLYSLCITFLGITQKYFTLSTNRLCSTVDVYCCMSVDAIVIATNSQSALPVALLH